MEPHKEVLKKTPQERKDERKARFQIMNLEQRIAPCNTRGHGCPHGYPGDR